MTTYEQIHPKQEHDDNEGMEVDTEDGVKNPKIEEHSLSAAESADDIKKATKPLEVHAKTISLDPNALQEPAAVPDMDTLYPVFWSLQESFSTPTRLFDDRNFQSFQAGLEITMRKFKAVHQELQDRGSAKLLDESKRGLKRKRNATDDELSSSFNPKYLTSRDLFDLEVPPKFHFDIRQK